MTKREIDFRRRLYSQSTTSDAAYTLEREAWQNYREAKTDKGRDRWDSLTTEARITGNIRYSREQGSQQI